MPLAVKSKMTGRYEPALICCWWMEPGKNRKLEKDDPMLVLATHSKDPVPNLEPWKKYIVVLLLRTYSRDHTRI